MKKKFSFLLVLLLALSTFLAACGGDKKTEGNEGASGEGGESAEKKEQVLNLIESSEIPSMDSTLATDAVSFNVMNNVFEGLYRLGEKDEPVLGMAAEEPQVSEDGKTYTFKIRDAKWSNGDAVTANDFVYAWQKALNPDTGAEYAYIMYDIKNAAKVNAGEVPVEELGVKAVDEKTLEVQLETAVPYFKALLSFATFYPQNQKFVEEQGDKFGLEADTAIYNGPFTLSEWKHEQSFKLTKNDGYWDAETVKLKEVNFNIVKDTATGVNLYETNKADVAGLSAEFVDKYKSDENFKTRAETSVFFLRLNQGNEIMANVNARKAIDAAYDKQGMVDVLLNNGSIPAYYLVPKDFVSGPDGAEYRETVGDFGGFDPEKAKEHWAKAKEELGKDSIELELLNYDSDNSKKIGEFLKEQLEQNLEGLTVSIKAQPFKQKLELESKGQYDFSFAGWGPDYPDPMTFVDMFVTDGAHNQMGYSNPEYDKLIEQAKGELLDDLDARWQAMVDAEKILFEDQAISPMYQSGVSYLERPYVKNILRHSFGADNSYKWASIE
ncbi:MULTISPECIES: peptide ABC transporter substrate-binding protein [Rossellomorea]|jgi:oligopeptide transport system substrate-binding protein|uniref:peptide ABC transporter substrate-binding protein n=1 Tax=Rossellomorea TaxID=2837508 RepID=UPI0011E96892|nr:MULTISPECIES: peptide ABC transporter substrate-binding protein [Rossellomorea]MDT9023591.1 peptide ABC transporter substrate-binding protein [Rossellomorea sp. YC4-1]TYS90828.1 peptide ABC transporter substrate-binding protein [Rossellomorea aquimaris]